jgi:hypothetical protein
MVMTRPSLNLVLYSRVAALVDDGLGGAFGGAAAHGQAAPPDGDVAHPVLVVVQVDQVLGELLRGVAFEPAEVLLEVVLDRVDGAVAVLELLAPGGQEPLAFDGVGLDQLERLGQPLDELKPIDCLDLIGDGGLGVEALAHQVPHLGCAVLDNSDRQHRFLLQTPGVHRRPYARRPAWGRRRRAPHSSS